MTEKTLQQKERELISKKDSVRAGDTWTINDARTRGHKSSITKRKGDEVEHVPRTHVSEIPRLGYKNNKLQENPQKDDKSDCYLLPEVQTSKVKNLGKKHDEPIKNPIDKSVLRHTKKMHKKKK